MFAKMGRLEVRLEVSDAQNAELRLAHHVVSDVAEGIVSHVTPRGIAPIAVQKGEGVRLPD